MVSKGHRVFKSVSAVVRADRVCPLVGRWGAVDCIANPKLRGSVLSQDQCDSTAHPRTGPSSEIRSVTENARSSSGTSTATDLVPNLRTAERIDAVSGGDLRRTPMKMRRI